MADLAFSSYHNIRACLEASHSKAADFLEPIIFLRESNLFSALTDNPVVYSSHIEDFWGNPQLVEDNGIVNIHSTVQGSAIVIT